MMFYSIEVRQGSFSKHGQINIRERALAENLVQHILIKLSQISRKLKQVPQDLQEVSTIVHDIYYGNFSLFQSLPDVWAIDQIMPVMPIHRLEEAPAHPAIISDITCDCDGKIDRFPDAYQERKNIMLHTFDENNDYYIGVFLVGAYQETLGDLHNLFGDTNVITIHVDENGGYKFTKELEGDSVEDVLSFVEYDVRSMKKPFETYR